MQKKYSGIWGASASASPGREGGRARTTIKPFPALQSRGKKKKRVDWHFAYSAPKGDSNLTTKIWKKSWFFYIYSVLFVILHVGKLHEDRSANIERGYTFF